MKNSGKIVENSGKIVENSGKIVEFLVGTEAYPWIKREEIREKRKGGFFSLREKKH